MSESNILKRVMLRCGEIGIAIFRNNIGVWIDKRGVPIRYGVCNPGGSDLLGWTSITVLPEHIGRQVAVFTAFECKDALGQPTAPQIHFLDTVRRAGGISGIVRSPEDAEALLAQPIGFAN